MIKSLSNHNRGNINSEKIAFDAEIIQNGSLDAAYIEFPFDTFDMFGTRGQVKIKAIIDGEFYRGSLANMGTGSHVIGILKDIRKKNNKTFGDIVHIELEQDFDERKIEIPEDLLLLLNSNEQEKLYFEKLSYTNQKEYVVWITSAKKTETRHARLAAILFKLKDGKKNPGQK
ncbi:MAG: YdeI/OmpD-associated family protein [Candidatus Kapabacteria bacterium]|nr:YdeI/OmpD-associated family protein [Candidatus Kapabacteria bacterium]